MELVFCKDKKDFCNFIESCLKCKFAKGNGVISGYIAHDLLATLFGIDYDLARLRELVQADIDGRCMIPPVKAGDTIYLVVPGRLTVNTIGDDHSTVTFVDCEMFGKRSSPLDGICNIIEQIKDVVNLIIEDTVEYIAMGQDGNGLISLRNSGVVSFSDIGDSIFLTHQEAQATLEKRARRMHLE